MALMIKHASYTLNNSSCVTKRERFEQRYALTL
ncbi:hypothetical protein Pecwa_3742 [Pectobacterium parmentieri WPP163]|nr:hypothetical protein Pecwa_3742 [Pectobacterium parmentieri WPP163]